MKFKDDDILDTWKYIIPLGIIVFLIPLIVRMKAVLATSVEKQVLTLPDFYSDFFSYNKGKILIILTCIALFYMLYALVLENIVIKKTLFYIPMSIYLVLAIISSFTSEYKHIALFGFYERYEGLIILGMYMLLLFLAINLASSKKSLVILLGFLFVSSLILCTIGLFQYFGYDLFQSYIGRKLMLPSKYFNSNVSVSMGKGTIYSTLLNSNYVGSYLTLTLPLIMSLILYIKNRKFKVGFSLIFLINFATLIGCNSRAGFMGFVASIIIYFVIRFKFIFKKKNLVFFSLILVLSVGVFVILNKVNNNRFYNSLSTMLTQLTTSPESQKKTNINDISLKDNSTIKLSLDKVSLYASFDSKSNLKFTDDNNNPIKYESNKENKITLLNDDFKNLTFSLKGYKESIVLVLQEGNLNIGFVPQDGTIKYFVPTTHRIYDIKPVDSMGFKGKEQLGSHRGYIWSRTLPMLKETLFLGKGPDTYAIYFPQQDFIAKVNCEWDQNIIVDKPHNFYLGTAFNTGILSLIALLAIFIMYFVQSLKLYFNKAINDLYQIIGFGLFLSTISYLVSCIFNDSIVAIAPVFWILIGSGISINLKLTKKNKNSLDLL